MNRQQLDAQIRAKLDTVTSRGGSTPGQNADALRAVLDYATVLDEQTFYGFARAIRERIAAELRVQP